MTTIEVLVPIADTRIERRALAPRLADLSGKRIGFLDNLKANAGELLAQVAAALRADGHVFEVIGGTKNATAAAPAEVLKQLMTCDAVVLAIAD